MALIAHIDESGTHDGSRLTVMAGWIGRAEKWREFDERWIALLQRPRPRRGSVSHIHGKDLRQGTKQFRGWPVEDRRQLAMTASGMAQEHSLFSVSVLLNNSDYDSITLAPIARFENIAPQLIPNMEFVSECSFL